MKVMKATCSDPTTQVGAKCAFAARRYASGYQFFQHFGPKFTRFTVAAMQNEKQQESHEFNILIFIRETDSAWGL